MIPHRIQAHWAVPPRKVVLMADPDAPTISDEVMPNIHDAAGVLLLCHEDDEQNLRNVIAREQEAPKVWRDWQRMIQDFNGGWRG